MLAYHNDLSLKSKYVDRMKAYMKADAIVQGLGWDGRKGCGIGCTFENYDHARGPIEIGVPETLMRLEDCIFERLPEDQAKRFPLAFLEAIPVGADLSMVWPRFAVWLLTSPDHGVLQHTGDDTRPSVEAVIDLYRRWVDGDQPPDEEFKEAAWTARAVARATWATRTATRAAEWAAWAARPVVEAAEAAEAAALATRAAAWAAEAAAWATRAAAWATTEGFWIAARDELLRLLREAPVADAA